ncbi:MAG: hypothetical protein QMD08_08215 [Actinomycetota bacterium]|nr:hypothetical protein [Actinomycetota bacterium]
MLKEDKDQGLQSEKKDQGSQSGKGDSFYDSLLSEIPEENREVLIPHLKKADAKVTQRLQEIAEREKEFSSQGKDELERYKELGSIESLQALANLQSYIRENPEEAISEIIDLYGLSEKFSSGEDEGDFEEDDPMVKLGKRLEALEKSYAKDIEERRQREEKEAIDRELADLHKKNPDIEFNPKIDRLLCFLAATECAGSLEKALELYTEDRQAAVNSYLKVQEEKGRGPSVEGAGGTPSPRGKELKTMTDAKQAMKERIEAVLSESK